MIHKQLTAVDSGAAATVQGKVNTTTNDKRMCVLLNCTIMSDTGEGGHYCCILCVCMFGVKVAIK